MGEGGGPGDLGGIWPLLSLRVLLSETLEAPWVPATAFWTPSLPLLVSGGGWNLGLAEGSNLEVLDPKA